MEQEKVTAEVDLEELKLLQLKAAAYDSLRELEQAKLRVVALGQEIEKVVNSRAAKS